MRVAAHAPSSWFLFEHEGAWLLDVLVSNGPASWTVPLAPDEVAAWEAEGTAAVEQLAAAVQARPSAFHERNEASRWDDAPVACVRAWRAAGEP